VTSKISDVHIQIILSFCNLAEIGYSETLNNSQQPVSFSSKTLAQAAQIAEKIESLEHQLSILLNGGNSIEVKPSTPKAATKPRTALPKRADSSAPNGSGDGRGTLRPAVVAILKESNQSLKTADIYDALVARGYKFTFKEAKKVLGIRLYKMLGVQPLGGGLFKAK
jgi:hypothetical protein